MKRILAFFSILIFICFSSAAASDHSVTDSTRSRDRTSTTKERVRKDDPGSTEHLYKDDSEENFFESCFSSCFSSFFEELLISMFSSSDENENSIAADSSGYASSLAAGEPSRPLMKEKAAAVKRHIVHTDYRNYLRAGIGGELFIGRAAEEYSSTAFSYRLSNMVYMKGFNVNISFSQGFAEGEPLYDYNTTIIEGAEVKEISDAALSASASNFSISAGAGYMFDLSDYAGLRFSLGALYQSLREETKLERTVILNGIPMQTRTLTEILEFSDIYPYAGADFYIYLNSEASVMLDFNFQYNFINRSPEKIKSTPLDWNKLTGEFIFGIGLSFDIL
jgi:hypothetical protein